MLQKEMNKKILNFDEKMRSLFKVERVPIPDESSSRVENIVNTKWLAEVEIYVKFD